MINRLQHPAGGTPAYHRLLAPKLGPEVSKYAKIVSKYAKSAMKSANFMAVCEKKLIFVIQNEVRVSI